MRWTLKTILSCLALGGLVTAGPLAQGLSTHGGCGCHNQHQSEGGVPIVGFPVLLPGAGGTDSCLACHATGNGAVLSPSPSLPSPEIGGGNFAFLLELNINDAPGGLMNPIAGNHAGHNVVTTTYGIQQDPDHVVAPGGTFPASELACTSCHDPHAEGSFRMLRGAGPVHDGIYNFTQPAPQAEGIPLTGSESQGSHTAYQDGWSLWCSNCHGMYHQAGNPPFEHPVNQALSMQHRDAYDRYRGEVDPTGGDAATAYLPEVPYEDSTVTPSTTSGPPASSRISCMSCHRAHATSAPEATRWDKTVLYLEEDGVVSGSYRIPNPYPGATQRALCIKCHVSETRTHGTGQACLECHGQSGL